MSRIDKRRRSWLSNLKTKAVSPTPAKKEVPGPKKAAGPSKKVTGPQPAKPTLESSKTAKSATQNDPRTQQTRANLDKSLPAPIPQTPSGLTEAERELSYQVPDASQKLVRASERERNSVVATRQAAALKRAIATGKPQDFENSEGKVVKVAARTTESGFKYALNGHPVDVSFGPELKDKEVQLQTVAQLVDYHSQQPSIANDVVDSIYVGETSGDHGARYTGRNKHMAINGLSQVKESLFNHEVGHGVGAKVSTNLAMMPEGWEQAVAQDGNEISGYGKSSFEEKNSSVIGWIEDAIIGSERAGHRADDFAEAYGGYREAQETGPQALAAFKKKFPHRSRMLERLMDRQLDSPLPLGSSDPVYA